MHPIFFLVFSLIYEQYLWFISNYSLLSYYLSLYFCFYLFIICFSFHLHFPRVLNGNQWLYFFYRQYWKDVSEDAKDFIDNLLLVDPNTRMTASQALKHSWIMSKAATASNKNLHRTISQNLLRRQSTRSSLKSATSRQSAKSLRSEHRHVLPEDIDALHRDPQIRAEIRSLSSRTNTPAKSPASSSS